MWDKQWQARKESRKRAARAAQAAPPGVASPERMTAQRSLILSKFRRSPQSQNR